MLKKLIHQEDLEQLRNRESIPKFLLQKRWMLEFLLELALRFYPTEKADTALARMFGRMPETMKDILKTLCKEAERMEGSSIQTFAELEDKFANGRKKTAEALELFRKEGKFVDLTEETSQQIKYALRPEAAEEFPGVVRNVLNAGWMPE